MSSPTCRLVTMGCKVNQYETQLVREALERNGYREAAEEEPADLCVINTCTVTGEADSKARGIIRQLARNNPGTKTVVFGCYAAREPQTLEKLPGVMAVVGDNRELPDVLQRFGIADFPDGISRFDGHRRAFVKVQDGCILNCTYCIIPTVRPGLRSRQPQEIIEEVRRLIDNGYKEIVLTGIHLGHFGVDTTRGKSGKSPYRLWHLIRDLNKVPGEWRLRLSSLESNELDDEFIDAVSDSERLCPHFHLCLQSGSDSVLGRMRRRYRSGRFLATLDRLRDALHNPAFSTDVIIGFPGETDAEFQETLDVCDQAGFMKIHTFPFSPRKGTPAAEFAGQIAPEIRKQRCQQLAELEGQLSQRYYQSLQGETLTVLVEAKPASRAGFVQGTACRFAQVELPGDSRDVGQLMTVVAEYPLAHGVSALRSSSSVSSLSAVRI